MKLTRIALALAVLCSLAGLAYVAQQSEGSGAKMVSAANAFLGSLDSNQKTKATFKFEDKERTKWQFTPQQDKDRKPTRAGLPLQDMNAKQKDLAIALVAAGTSANGHKEAVTVMSLEAILNELEKGRAIVRDPEWYFFTIFGTPSKTGKWGWRVEGHHLSLNFTMDGNQVVTATPCFYGANPATVMAGPKKGQRTLAPSDDLARQLFRSLDDSQKKIAHVPNKFREVEERSLKPTLDKQPQGIAAAKLKPDQREILTKLLHSYLDRMPPDVAALELEGVKKGGVDNIHFAFTGSPEQGQKRTYRVQGPSFVIEFINEQADSAGNQANHIHSVWRRVSGDFGIN